jgi:hypothetical protein
MQATYRPITLQPGQAPAVDWQASARVLVTEGEVLVQAPAQWLGEQVLLAVPRRVVAPAALVGGTVGALVAVGAAKLQVEQVSSLPEKARAGWRQLRAGWLRAPRLSRESGGVPPLSPPA